MRNLLKISFIICVCFITCFNYAIGKTIFTVANESVIYGLEYIHILSEPLDDEVIEESIVVVEDGVEITIIEGTVYKGISPSLQTNKSRSQLKNRNKDKLPGVSNAKSGKNKSPKLSFRNHLFKGRSLQMEFLDWLLNYFYLNPSNFINFLNNQRFLLDYWELFYSNSLIEIDNFKIKPYYNSSELAVGVSYYYFLRPPPFL